MSEDNQHPPMVIAHRGGENLNKTIKYFFGKLLENFSRQDKVENSKSKREREKLRRKEAER